MNPEADKGKIDLQFLSNCFDGAMKDVLGTMAGFELKNIEDFAEEKQSYRAEITGAMLLQGQHNALLTISMSRETATIIVTYMTGMMPDEFAEDELYDCLAELVNLVAGRTKAQLTNTQYHFKLSPPFTIVGVQEHFLVHKNKVQKITIKYGTTNMEFLLEIFYT